MSRSARCVPSILAGTLVEYLVKPEPLVSVSAVCKPRVDSVDITSSRRSWLSVARLPDRSNRLGQRGAQFRSPAQ
jgi:hypothetical protein